MASGTIVHPSSVSYRLVYGLTNPDIQPPEVSRAMAQGTSFHDFLQKDVLASLEASGRLGEVLQKFGADKITQEMGREGNMSGIPMKGTGDTFLWKDGKVFLYVDAKRHASGKIESEIPYEGGDPSQVNYNYQFAGYMHMLRQSGELAENAKMGASGFKPGEIQGLLKSWNDCRGDAKKQQDLAVKIFTEYIQRGLSSSVSAPTEVDCEPGGRYYEAYKTVQEQSDTIYEMTGVSPVKLSTQRIPKEYENQYKEFYAKINAAQQTVAAGEASVEQMTNILCREARQIDVPLETSRLESGRGQHIQESKEFGSIRPQWGTEEESKELGKYVAKYDSNTIKVRAGELDPEVGGLQPAGFSATLDRFQNRSVINGVVIGPTQDPSDMTIAEPRILNVLRDVYNRAGGGKYGENAVKKQFLDMTRGLPRLRKNYLTTSTAAARALMANLVTTTSKLPRQEWYDQSRADELVSHNADAGTAFPVKTLTSVLGWVKNQTTGEYQVGLTKDKAGNIVKRSQLAFRRDSILWAPNPSGRNIASPFRMAGAQEREFGVRARVAVMNAMPEGMGYLDADVVRKMGGLEGDFAVPIDLGEGLSFTKKVEFADGQWFIGSVGGRRIPFPSEGWVGMSGLDVEETNENGTRQLMVTGHGKADPNSDAVKNYLASKFVAVGSEGLSQSFSESDIEVLVPMFKDVRQGVGSMLSGKYGQNPKTFNQLVAALKRRGVDVEQLGLLEKSSSEEREIALQKGVDLPKRRIVWGTNDKLDEALLGIAQQMAKKGYRDRLTRQVVMSHENFLMMRKGVGSIIPDSVMVDQEKTWADNPDERREVTLKLPAMITDLMMQPIKLEEARASISFEDLKRLVTNDTGYSSGYKATVLGKIFPDYASGSAHTRSYYDDLLKAAIGSNSEEYRGTLSTITLPELRDKLKEAKGESFIEKLREVAKDSFINLGDGYLLPPGESLATMAVPSELERMTQPQKGQEDIKFPTAESNAIISRLEGLTKVQTGSNAEKTITGDIKRLVEELDTSKSVVKGLLSANLTGSGATSSTGASFFGLRPNEVALGKRSLRQLIGGHVNKESLASLSSLGETLGDRALVALGLRQPVSDPTTPFTATEVWLAKKVREIPEEFQGMVLPSGAQDVYQGDYDGEFYAMYMASQIKEGGELFTNKALADAASNQGYMNRMFKSLEMKLGTKITGPRTFKNYLDIVTDSKLRGIEKASEIRKWVDNLNEQSVGPESFLDAKKYHAGLSVEDVRTGHLTFEMSKQQKAPPYNLFGRNMDVVAKSMGIADDPLYSGALQRLRYYSNQEALDRVLSAGDRSLIGIAHGYTIGESGGGRIEDKYNPVPGKVASKDVLFNDLPGEIIRGLLSSGALSGFGEHEKGHTTVGLTKASYAKDISRMITTNADYAQSIEDIISKNIAVSPAKPEPSIPDSSEPKKKPMQSRGEYAKQTREYLEGVWTPTTDKDLLNSREVTIDHETSRWDRELEEHFTEGEYIEPERMEEYLQQFGDRKDKFLKQLRATRKRQILKDTLRDKWNESPLPGYGKTPYSDLQLSERDKFAGTLDKEEMKALIASRENAMDARGIPGISTALAEQRSLGGEGLDVEAVTKDIASLYQNRPGDYWKHAGPMFALLGTHISKRGLKSKSATIRGTIDNLIQGEVYSGHETQGKQGFALFEDIVPEMEKEQRVASAHYDDPKDRNKMRTLFEDLLSAKSPDALRKSLWALGESAQKAIKSALRNIPSFDRDPSKQKSMLLARIEEREARLLKAVEGVPDQVVDEAIEKLTGVRPLEGKNPGYEQQYIDDIPRVTETINELQRTIEAGGASRVSPRNMSASGSTEFKSMRDKLRSGIESLEKIVEPGL